MNTEPNLKLLKSLSIMFILIYSSYIVLSAISVLIFGDASIAYFLPLLQLLCFMLFPLLFTLKNEWNIKHTFKFNGSVRLVFFLAAIASMVGFFIMSAGYYSIFENLLEGDMLIFFEDTINSQVMVLNEILFHNDLLVVFMASITIVLIAPIAEEFLFRGFMLSPLEEAIKSKQAIVVTAALFALIHTNIAAFPLLFTLGIILGYFAVYTQNLIVPIFIHIVNNLFAYLNMQLFYDPVSNTNNTYSMTLPGAVLFFIFGAVIIIYSIYYITDITKSLQVEE